MGLGSGLAFTMGLGLTLVNLTGLGLMWFMLLFYTGGVWVSTTKAFAITRFIWAVA